MQHKREGVLYIVSTPIGNLEDITLRALRILREADFIAAEDTRRTRQLLAHYGIQKPLVSYHEHSRESREEALLKKLREGKTGALVTDAGTPGISDPGEPLVRRAVREGIPLVPIPGPSAAVAALSVSGLPAQSFLFCGFPPAKASARRKCLEALKERTETLIFYESPRRLAALLREALTIFGNRPAAVAREVTKVFEEIRRGTLEEILPGIEGEEVKGEITVVLAGAGKPEPTGLPEIREALRERLATPGVSWKEAVAEVARELGAGKKEVYREALALKKNPSSGS